MTAAVAALGRAPQVQQRLASVGVTPEYRHVVSDEQPPDVDDIARSMLLLHGVHSDEHRVTDDDDVRRTGCAGREGRGGPRAPGHLMVGLDRVLDPPDHAGDVDPEMLEGDEGRLMRGLKSTLGSSLLGERTACPIDAVNQHQLEAARGFAGPQQGRFAG